MMVTDGFGIGTYISFQVWSTMLLEGSLKDHLSYKCYPDSVIKFWTSQVDVVLNLSCVGQL